MINLLWSGFIFLVLLSGCGWNGTPTRNNDFIPVTSIEISAISSTIAANTSTRLSVKGNFSGQFTRDITDQVVWSSDAPTVAGFVIGAVPSRVTGIAPGSATLTATTGGVSATYTLTVSSATLSKLTISPADPFIAKGLGTQFTVSGDFSDSTTQDMTFDATWASSASGVATVSNDAVNKCFLQTLAVGTSTITATFAINGVSDSTLLTVTAPSIRSIELSPTNPSVLTLNTRSFKATGTYSDGSTADITSRVTWNSSNTVTATIAGNGTATTLAQGTTAISATLDGVSQTTNLKTTGGNLTAITLTAAGTTPVGSNITLASGTNIRMTATGLFNNGSTRDISGVVLWSTANPNLATVTLPAGNMIFLNAKAATPATTVTVKSGSGSVTATATLTVTATTLLSIAISPVNLNMTAGTTDRVKVSGSFDDGTTQDLTASDGTMLASSNTSFASVGNSSTELANKGRVGGITTGLATINANYGNLSAPVPASVNVTAPTVVNLAISPATPTVATGNMIQFTATATFSNGTSQIVTEDTVWTIDNPNIAILADSLNQPGQVVGVDGGTATLTASFLGLTPSPSVTIIVTP